MPSVYKAPYVMVDSERRVISAEIKAPQNDLEMEVLMSEDENLEETARDKASKIISEAHINAEQIISNARETAEKILHQANLDVSDIFEKNLKKGKAEGYEEGHKKGIADTNKIKADAEALYQDSLAERQRILDSIESEVVALILDILDKLISDAVVINPQIITYLIKKGLNDSSQADNIVIHVSPEDYEMVSEMRSEFITSVNSKIDVVSDTSLSKMDCVIETQFGSIDCSLVPQLNSIKNDLYYIFKNG